MDAVLTKIDGFEIELETEQFVSANTLRVSVGTNCPQGGDAGHGGRTILVLDGANSTDFDGNFSGHRVELVFRGDTECETLIDGLEFAANVLRKQLGQKGLSRKTN